jgi:hypothetical protein
MTYQPILPNGFQKRRNDNSPWRFLEVTNGFHRQTGSYPHLDEFMA